MNWSAYVLGLLDQKYSLEDIVILADNPFITIEYVKAVRATVTKIYPYTVRGPYKPKSPTMLMVDAYVKEVGVKVFRREYKKLTSYGLAKKIGVSPLRVRQYMDRCIRGRKGVTKIRGKHLTYDAKLIATGKKAKPVEQITMEEFKTLW